MKTVVKIFTSTQTVFLTHYSVMGEGKGGLALFVRVVFFYVYSFGVLPMLLSLLLWRVSFLLISSTGGLCWLLRVYTPPLLSVLWPTTYAHNGFSLRPTHSPLVCTHTGSIALRATNGASTWRSQTVVNFQMVFIWKAKPRFLSVSWLTAALFYWPLRLRMCRRRFGVALTLTLVM